MDEEIAMYLQESEELMEKAIKHTKTAFSKIRAGKASPSMLDGLTVEYYGATTPLNQLASVSAPDARVLAVTPFDKGALGDIERAIRNSDLGFSPQSDGQVIRINIPQLTEERRKQLVKQAKELGENGKISVRNIRKDTNNQLKDLQKEGFSEDAIKKAEEEVQKLTNSYSAKIDDLLSQKEKEILSI